MMQRIIRMTLVAALGCGLAACEDDSPDETEPVSSAPETESTSKSPTKPAESTPIGAQGASKKSAGLKAPSKLKTKSRRKSAKKAMKALGDAMKAAQAAEKKGGSNCEKAYHSVVAMAESLGKSQGKDLSGKKPDKDAFVAACEEMPESLQKCMVPSYSMKHQQECKKARKNADPQQLQKLKGLMKKKAQ